LLQATLPELRRGLTESAARTVAYELFEKLGYGAVAVTDTHEVLAFVGSGADHQFLTLIDAAKLSSGKDAVLGTIPAGGFPRELRVTADGQTLLVTNFSSRTVELIDLSRLQLSH
jgi:DNA-binding beta-propeller fold protein YncE